MLDVRWELFFSCDFWVGNGAALPEFRSVYYRTKIAYLFGVIVSFSKTSYMPFFFSRRGATEPKIRDEE